MEIVGLGKDQVRFVWDDEKTTTFGARLLRVWCTCAHCQSETTGERLLDPATISTDITVTQMELTGNYGVNIHFSDGHTTGIYRFRALLEHESDSEEHAKEHAKEMSESSDVSEDTETSP